MIRVRLEENHPNKTRRLFEFWEKDLPMRLKSFKMNIIYRCLVFPPSRNVRLFKIQVYSLFYWKDFPYGIPKDVILSINDGPSTCWVSILPIISLCYCITSITSLCNVHTPKLPASLTQTTILWYKQTHTTPPQTTHLPWGWTLQSSLKHWLKEKETQHGIIPEKFTTIIPENLSPLLSRWFIFGWLFGLSHKCFLPAPLPSHGLPVRMHFNPVPIVFQTVIQLFPTASSLFPLSLVLTSIFHEDRSHNNKSTVTIKALKYF